MKQQTVSLFSYLAHPTTQAPTTTTTTTTTTTAPTTTIAPSFCQSNGFCNHADPTRCDTYIACDKSGRGLRMPCPKGLYYNSKADICDYPKNVECNLQGKIICMVEAFFIVFFFCKIIFLNH